MAHPGESVLSGWSARTSNRRDDSSSEMEYSKVEMFFWTNKACTSVRLPQAAQTVSKATRASKAYRPDSIKPVVLYMLATSTLASNSISESPSTLFTSRKLTSISVSAGNVRPSSNRSKSWPADRSHSATDPNIAACGPVISTTSLSATWLVRPETVITVELRIELGRSTSVAMLSAFAIQLLNRSSALVNVGHCSDGNGHSRS
eukprot:3314164-Rhodomonas_salina.1